MNSIHTHFEDADILLSNISMEDRDKFKKRYISVLEQMESYILKSGFSHKVHINKLLLGYLLIDYFDDVHRLKEYHKIKHINSIKLISYMTYWLLRRKPIQLDVESNDVLYVNERFALAYVLNFLSNEDKKHILERSNEGLKNFSESLFYFFKYRQFNAQDIEMIIMSFYSGQIYQESTKDLSADLPASDY